jgi:lysozyme
MIQSRNLRTSVGVITLSAIGFATVVVNNEGWSDHPIVPVPGDPLTIGPGLTSNIDGSPIRPNQTITPPQGIRMGVAQIAKDESVLKKCFGTESYLYQYEWDAYVDLSHNVGPYSVCKSSIVSKVKAEQYEEACNTILEFKRVQRRDCSLPENKRFCGGVWTRRLKTNKLCLTGEYPK